MQNKNELYMMLLEEKFEEKGDRRRKKVLNYAFMLS